MRLQTTGTVTLRNVTITSNRADGDYGGIARVSGAASVANTIVAGDTPERCEGPLTSLGHNLLPDPGACAVVGDATGNVSGLAPQLGPLQYNGGETFTHAPLLGSPVLELAPGTLRKLIFGLKRAHRPG